MKQSIIFGAGNIGRGFIGQLFSESGYEVAFADIDRPLLEALNARGRYTIRLVTNERTEEVTVGPVRALHSGDLDAVADNLLSQRARLGETLNRSDSVEVRLSQQSLAAQAERSAAEDLDMVQAVSDFQNQQTGYDAALKAYALVQRMSLFQYINA